MNYIRYHETEKLFTAWPYLQDLLDNLSLDIMAARVKDSMGSADDYIYTMVIGNKALSNMPPAGKISDSTGNIAENYHKMMLYDRKAVKQEISVDIIEISLVVSKLEIAYRRLSFFQRRILQLYYWEDKTWKEIVAHLKCEGLFYSSRQIQEKRRAGIEKMTSVMTVTIETYESVMKLMEEKNSPE